MRPPRVPGLPLVGNMLQFRKNPVQCIERACAEFGPIFTLRLGPMSVVVLVGPELHRWFCRETDRTLSTQDVYKFLTPMFGQVLGACPAARYQEQRRAILPFFGGAFTATQVAIMARTTQEKVDSLGKAGSFELWDLLEEIALTIAAESVLGRDLLGSETGFHEMFRAIARGMDYILPPDLPLPRFIRRNRARRRLSALIRPLVLRRRQQPRAYDDFLQDLSTARGGDDELLPIDTVVGLTLIMIHGAYETVAAQACWCLLDLLSHADACCTILSELEQATPGRCALDADALFRMPRMRSAIQESMRLRPAATVVCRQASAELELDGYTIPKGALVMVCPGAAHQLADVFPDPKRYDIDRFSRGRFGSHHYLTFGSGPHRCLGFEFAMAEIQIFLATFLRAFELRPATPSPRPYFGMSVTRPASPCMIAYSARPPAAAAAAPAGSIPAI